jgi:undecaprenyl-diphosphatase
MQQFITLLDQRLLSLITQLPASLRPTMEVVSMIGQPVAMAGIVAVIIVVGRYQNDSRLVRGGILLILALLASNALKLILQRTRPDTYIPRLYHSYSFPSGHAFATLVVLGLVAWLSWHHLTAPWGWIAGLVCVLLIGLVGISRVYLGAHYPTDVLGGWLIGALVLIGIIAWAKL